MILNYFDPLTADRDRNIEHSSRNINYENSNVRPLPNPLFIIYNKEKNYGIRFITPAASLSVPLGPLFRYPGPRGAGPRQGSVMHFHSSIIPGNSADATDES